MYLAFLWVKPRVWVGELGLQSLQSGSVSGHGCPCISVTTSEKTGHCQSFPWPTVSRDGELGYSVTR